MHDLSDTALDRQLRTETAPAPLSVLWSEAAARAADPDAFAFNLTQAWIYALVAGDTAATHRFEAALSDLGRV